MTLVIRGGASPSRKVVEMKKDLQGNWTKPVRTLFLLIQPLS